MRAADFDYELPEEAIAQRPVKRGESRLLVVSATAAKRHRQVADLPQLLRPGDLLVVNDTRVIPARLFGHRPRGGRVELLLLERLDPTSWEALVRPGRRTPPGTGLRFDDGLEAEVLERLPGGRFRLRFDAPVEPTLERCGHVPLPPYIRRPDDQADRERYQTVYAREPGAVAAPTAGLHLSTALLDALAGAGVDRAAITLHVGLGTFRPMTCDDVRDHRMEQERYEVPPATTSAIAAARARGGRVVAVGTTVVRALESAASNGLPAPGMGRTSLFITPGYRFQVVDLLLTNFHLPRSTLLLLVTAFAGRERILTAYAEALAQGYRFYSYGDAMLLERQEGAEAAAAPPTDGGATSPDSSADRKAEP